MKTDQLVLRPRQAIGVAVGGLEGADVESRPSGINGAGSAHEGSGDGNVGSDDKAKWIGSINRGPVGIAEREGMRRTAGQITGTDVIESGKAAGLRDGGCDIRAVKSNGNGVGVDRRCLILHFNR